MELGVPAGSETQPVRRKTIISWPWPGSSLALAGAAPAGSETQPVRRSSIISWPWPGGGDGSSPALAGSAPAGTTRTLTYVWIQ